MTLKGPETIPVYLRLRSMVADAIISGQYRAGTQLPSVRSFAAQTGTNPLTVAKAYQTLQDEAVIEVKRGVGMFVASDARSRLRTSERDQFLHMVWPDVLEKIDRLGLSVEDLLEQSRV